MTSTPSNLTKEDLHFITSTFSSDPALAAAAYRTFSTWAHHEQAQTKKYLSLLEADDYAAYLALELLMLDKIKVFLRCLVTHGKKSAFAIQSLPNDTPIGEIMNKYSCAAVADIRKEISDAFMVELHMLLDKYDAFFV